MKRIVVGIDGSTAAAAALRWAVTEAAVHGARVEAWHAWYPVHDPAGPPPDEVAGESAARSLLGAAVEGTDAEPVLVRAVAASALLDASRDADLLVLGAAAHRGPRLGSVSAQVVANAHCAVVVLPATS